MTYVPEGRRRDVLKGYYERHIDYPDTLRHDEEFRRCRLCWHGERLDGIYWCRRCAGWLAECRAAAASGGTWSTTTAYVMLDLLVAWSAAPEGMPWTHPRIGSAEFYRWVDENRPREPEALPESHHYWKCRTTWDAQHSYLLGGPP